MMNKITEGRGTAGVLMNSLTLHINDSEYAVHSEDSFYLNVKFFHEDKIYASEDEEGCPEYFEFLEIHTAGTLRLKNLKGVMMTIEPEFDLKSVLYEHQLDEIEANLRKQARGYVDNDNLRPDVNRRIQQELGMGLKDYDWSDK